VPDNPFNTANLSNYDKKFCWKLEIVGFFETISIPICLQKPNDFSICTNGFTAATIEDLQLF
jgi:hypothetical protein